MRQPRIAVRLSSILFQMDASMGWEAVGGTENERRGWHPLGVLDLTRRGT